MAVSILELAPSLAEPGKRLIDAGELYRVLQAIVDGTIPIAGVPPTQNVLAQAPITLTAGDNTIAPSDWSPFVPGTTYSISGANIPPGATATYPEGATSMTLSFTPATSSGVIITFTPAA